MISRLRFGSLFGENQFTLARFAQAVQLPLMLNPDFITASRKVGKADDLWKQRCRMARRFNIGLRNLGTGLLVRHRVVEHAWGTIFFAGLTGVPLNFCVRLQRTHSIVGASDATDKHLTENDSQ